MLFKKNLNKKTLLIVTTNNDQSAKLFLDREVSKKLKVTSVYYDQDISTFELTVSGNTFDYVYFRDPFNDGDYDLEDIRYRIEIVKAAQSSSMFVDNVHDFDGVMFEDKYFQYKMLSDFMAHTEILDNKDKFVRGSSIIKKRISARAKDIAFDLKDDYIGEDYIVQPLLDIKTEYRVYCFGEMVLEKGSIKSSKKLNTKVKVKEIVNLPQDVINFSSKIVKLIPDMDLVGLDIAVTKNGQMYLIEVNRSCQFATFSKYSNINLAIIFTDNLLKKSSNAPIVNA